MGKLKLIATNLFTAVIVAAVTSAFWIVAFNNGSEEKPQRRPSPAVPKPAVDPNLVIGPTGLAIPVKGVEASELSDTFTQSRAGGGRVHNAIDIMAPHGTPVVAAAPGTLEKLFFSQGGGGITAYVRSPDKRFIYYYAHLQEYAPGLKEGQPIKRGDPIGTVGSTGNANPGGPHLHFSIQRMAPDEKWYGGTPINPYPLLAGRQPAR